MTSRRSIYKHYEEEMAEAEEKALEDGRAAAELLKNPLVTRWFDRQSDKMRLALRGDNVGFPLPHDQYIALHAHQNAVLALYKSIKGAQQMATDILAKRERRGGKQTQ